MTPEAGRSAAGRLAVALMAAALLVAPRVAPRYHVTLLLPFMAYAVVLLGLNLLFA